MADVNNCTFTGRLTRDAEKKTIPTGTELITFSLANNTGYGTNEKVLYLTVNMWGKSGQGVFQYLTKGKHVAVWGELEEQRWTSKEGIDQKKLVLNCMNVRLLGGGQKQETSTPAQSYEGEAYPMDEEVPVF